jgi:hypothetical protein
VRWRTTTARNGGGRYIAPRVPVHATRFLNEVLGQFTPGCPVDQISEEPIVIPRHHSANEFRVSSPQCTRDALRLGFRHTRKGRHHGNHTLYTRSSPGIMHATHLEDPKTFQRALPGRVADSSSLAASNLASCPNGIHPRFLLTNHQKRFSAFAGPGLSRDLVHHSM